jgi:hypothetical protein
MKKLIVVAGLALVLNGRAYPDTLPTLEIQSGGSSIDVALSSEGNGIWGISGPEVLSVGGSSVNLTNVTLDVDPSVHYAVSANNDVNAADGTSTFWTFTFTTPVSLDPGVYSVSASAAGSLTDGGSNGVTLSPANSVPIQQSFISGNDAGVDLLTSPVTSSAAALSAPFSATPLSSTYTLTSSATQISVTTSFDLSDNDDATVSGRFDVAAVPEPTSFLLALIAAGAFVLVTVRVRSKIGMRA